MLIITEWFQSLVVFLLYESGTCICICVCLCHTKGKNKVKGYEQIMNNICTDDIVEFNF